MVETPNKTGASGALWTEGEKARILKPFTRISADHKTDCVPSRALRERGQDGQQDCRKSRSWPCCRLLTLAAECTHSRGPLHRVVPEATHAPEGKAQGRH